MPVQIAPTEFITTQDSGLATKDVYDTNPETLIGNAFVASSGWGFDMKMPILSGKIGEVTQLFDGIKKNAAGIKQGINGVREIIKNKDKILSDLKDSISTDLLTHVGLGSYAGSINDVIAGRKSPESLLGVISSKDPQMKIIIDGVQTIRNAKDLDSAKGVFDLLGAVTGNSKLAEVLNLQPEFILYSNLLTKASKLRIPEITDKVLEYIDKDQKDKIYLANINRVTENSDLVTLEKIAEELGYTAVINSYPNVVKTLLESYTTLSGDSPTLKEAEEFDAFLTKLDKDWLYSYRGDSKVINFGLFENISSDSYDTLNLLDKYQSFLPIARLYPVDGIRGLTTKYKPWITVF